METGNYISHRIESVISANLILDQKQVGVDVFTREIKNYVPGRELLLLEEISFEIFIKLVKYFYGRRLESMEDTPSFIESIHE